jgi:hypothetical protein
MMTTKSFLKSVAEPQIIEGADQEAPALQGLGKGMLFDFANY